MYTSMTLQSILDKNRVIKCEILDLSHYVHKNIPSLSKYVWLKKLKIYGSMITKINKKSLPPNLEILNLSNNDIDSISPLDIHSNIKVLLLHQNNIKMFDGEGFDNIIKLDISSNNMIHFNSFPKNVKECRLIYNELEKLPEFNKALEILDVSENDITSIPKIHKGLIELDVSGNKIKEFPLLSDTITKFVFDNNEISKIDKKLPSSLEYLDGEGNLIEKIDTVLPAGLLEINLSSNRLENMIDLPGEILKVNLSDNIIKEIKIEDVPYSLTYFDISRNEIKDIPEELCKRSLNILYSENNITSPNYYNGGYNNNKHHNNWNNIYNNRSNYYNPYNSGYSSYYNNHTSYYNRKSNNPYYIPTDEDITL